MWLIIKTLLGYLCFFLVKQGWFAVMFVQEFVKVICSKLFTAVHNGKSALKHIKFRAVDFCKKINQTSKDVVKDKLLHPSQN